MSSQNDPVPETHVEESSPHGAYSDVGEEGSILSSRMTDIASDDGGENVADTTRNSAARQPAKRRSVQTATSRPNTGVTGVSSQRGTWGQAPPSRRGHAAQNSASRGSAIGGASISTGRPQSSTSRSHVPSLTSHAFFHPMSSQRLQAQRGGSRPPATSQQGVSEDNSAEGGSSLRHSVNSTQTLRQAGTPDPDGRPPPSRGTEMTEQETMERITANTSPTHGHNAAGSLTESVRPLQRNPVNSKGLSLNIDKSYKNINGLPTPSKSPRSFRSSFLLPTRGDVAPNSPNRSMEGREKLPSAASSPGFSPAEPPPKTAPKPKLGKNYEYFTGNTVFCWGGRLQNTKHRPINIGTGLLFLIPGVLFFIFSASWLWHHISPAIPIVFAYIFYIGVSSFIHVSVTDPGVSSQKITLLSIFTNRLRFCPAIFTKCRLRTRMKIPFD